MLHWLKIPCVLLTSFYPMLNLPSVVRWQISKSTSEEWFISIRLYTGRPPIRKWQRSFFLFSFFCFVCLFVLYLFSSLSWPRKFTWIIEYSVDQFIIVMSWLQLDIIRCDICLLCIFKFQTLTCQNSWIFYFTSKLTLYECVVNVYIQR